MNTNELTALDRCDRCGAQAYVRLDNLKGAELLFCAHHQHVHGDALKDKGFRTVVDQTARLQAATS